MSEKAFKTLMDRCKGSIAAAKAEILRGLSMPEYFTEFVVLNKNGEVKEIQVNHQFVDEIMEIIVV